MVSPKMLVLSQFWPLLQTAMIKQTLSSFAVAADVQVNIAQQGRKLVSLATLTFCLKFQKICC